MQPPRAYDTVELVSLAEQSSCGSSSSFWERLASPSVFPIYHQSVHALSHSSLSTSSEVVGSGSSSISDGDCASLLIEHDLAAWSTENPTASWNEWLEVQFHADNEQ
eukprot:728501-Amphidinium_carterae.1